MGKNSYYCLPPEHEYQYEVENKKATLDLKLDRRDLKVSKKPKYKGILKLTKENSTIIEEIPVTVIDIKSHKTATAPPQFQTRKTNNTGNRNLVFRFVSLMLVIFPIQ